MAVTTATINLVMAGTNGAATGEALSSIPVNGVVRGVHVAYPDGANVATEVKLESLRPTQLLIDETGNTSGWVYPETAGGQLLAVDEMLKATGGAGNAGTVVITVLLEV